MRAKTLVICVLAGAILVAGGYVAATSTNAGTPREAFALACDAGAPARGTPVEKSIVAKVGESFRVSLCSNPSTGFSWGDPTISPATVLSALDRNTVAASGDLIGAAGSEAFTFKVLAPGTATVTFAYGQGWAGGAQAASTVVLTVVAS